MRQAVAEVWGEVVTHSVHFGPCSGDAAPSHGDGAGGHRVDTWVDTGVDTWVDTGWTWEWTQGGHRVDTWVDTGWTRGWTRGGHGVDTGVGPEPRPRDLSRHKAEVANGLSVGGEGSAGSP